MIDEVTVVEMPSGQSYTGQNQAELFCHGGQFVLKKTLGEILRHGVRPAEPGEFTRRAFLAGRIDLARAEAVAEIIASKTEYAYNAARKNLLGELSDDIEQLRRKSVELLAEIEASIDFPEEDIEPAERSRRLDDLDAIIVRIKELIESYRSGKLIKEGYRIAIGGRTNAGKSSLFNLLLNQSRAIVATVPGTTRDYLTEWIDLDGMAVALTDTAGLRDSSDVVEKAGQESARAIIREADLTIWMVDISEGDWAKTLDDDLPDIKRLSGIIIVLNKVDLLDTPPRLKSLADYREAPIILSCRTRRGLQEVKKELSARINANLPDLTDRLVITSERHKRKLAEALRTFRKARRGLKDDIEPELLAVEIRSGLNAIDEITGRVYNEEVLDRIFSKFCIGK